MGYRNKELAIESAIQEYKNSISFGVSSRINRVINMMENVYIMCTPYNIKGVDTLGKAIKEAKEVYASKASGSQQHS